MTSLQLRLRDDQSGALVEDSLGLLFYALDEDVAGGNVVDETHDLAGGPDTVLGVAVGEDLLAALAADKGGNLAELARLALALDLEGLLGDLVLEEAAGVAPAAEDEGGLVLVGLDNGLLDVLVEGRLDGAHEAGAHVDAGGAEAEGGGEAVAVGEAAAGDEGDGNLLAGAAEEDKVGNVALADVAGALEAVDAEEVDAELDGGEGVADGGALVEDDDAGSLELLDDGAGRVAGRLDDADALVNDGLGVRGVVGGHHGGQQGHVDGKGLLGEGAAAADLVAEGGRVGEDEGRDDAEAARVGDGGGEVGCANVHHAALDNGHCEETSLSEAMREDWLERDMSGAYLGCPACG